MSAKPRKLKNERWRAERRHNGELRFLGDFKLKREAQEALDRDVEAVGINPRGGRPSRGAPADTKINFRVTPEERKIITAFAKDLGLSVAEYCRGVALGEI